MSLVNFSRSVLVILAACTPLAAADWPNFRGPNHDGISQETGLKLEWKTPLPLVWDRDVGPAFSSFAAVGDRIYTAGTIERKQTVVCLNALTGEIIWKTGFEGEYKEAQGGDGPRATPTVNDGHVYMLGARGKLVCLDAASGQLKWEQSFRKVPTWGYSGSVLIEGDMAIVSPGGSHGALLALNKRTGEMIWSAGSDAPGYATPYPFTFEGERYIVGFIAKHAIIVRAKDGQEVLRIPWVTAWDVNAAAPIFHEGHLLIGSGYATGTSLYRLEREGEKLTAKPVWGVSKDLMLKFQSAVLVDGKLFASDQDGLRCIDFKTGKALWKQRRVGDGPSAKDGTILAAEGHLIFLAEHGELFIAPASGEKFEPITTAEILSGRCWAVPIIHNGRLYARDQSRLVCFALR